MSRPHPARPLPAQANPFGSVRIEALPFEPQGWTWDELWTRLEAFGYRGAVVGPEGSGKTTLLEHIERELVQRGWRVHRLRGSLTRPRLAGTLPPRLGPQDIVIVDSGEAVPWLTWYRLRWRGRKAGGLLVTLHSPGRLPTLVENKTSPELLLRLVRRLVPEADPALEAAALGLFRRHNGNVRETLRGLYDHAAGLRA